MKRTFFLLALLAAIPLFSQQWVYDYDQALKLAKEGNKKIILVFSGSDWCAPCIKLERDIWNNPQFPGPCQGPLRHAPGRFSA